MVKNMEPRHLRGLLVLLAVMLGFVGYAYSQNVVTTTTTRVVIIQPTTFVTEITVSGTTLTATVQVPGHLIIVDTNEPGRLFTITFTPRPQNVVVIPGTTVSGTPIQ